MNVGGTRSGDGARHTLELTLGRDIAVCERVRREATSRAFRHGVYPEKDSGRHQVDETYASVIGPALHAQIDQFGR